DNNGKTALFFATWDMIAIFLIKEGADVSVVDNEGKSVLHYATNKNIIHIFITHGANVALVSKLGQTVLHSAAADERIQAIHTLLAIKDGNEHSVVDINAVDEKGQTALSYSLIAGKFPAAIALIQAGAKLDEQTMQAKDVQQRSLLHYTAADKSLSGVMQQLIDAHVNVNAPDKKGRTPLHYAAKRGNLEAIIALRAAGADFNAVDHSGKTVLHYAAKKNQAAAIIVLAEQLTSENINQKDNKGLTALAYAFNEETETYQLEATIVLLEAGAECSLRLLAQKEYNLDCKTLLHVAAAMNKPKTIHALITAGADVDAVDRYCQTALHCAVINKHMLAVKALIAANIDINAADSKGKTALHYAVQQGNQDMVALLISKGANIEAQDREGKTPLHYIAENSDIHSLIKRCNEAKEMDTKLLLHNAVFHQDKQLIALMIAEGSDIEERDEDGKTPLHYAAKTGDKEIVEFLISHGASVESKDKDGKTPLHYAVETGDESIITFLISRGANIEAKNKEGNTPLHDVAKQDNEKIFYLMFNESRRFKAKKIAFEIAELKSRGYTDEDISYRVKTPIPGDIPIIGNVKNRTPLDYAGERIRRMESGRLLMRSYHTFLTECPEAVKDTHPGFKKLKKKFIAHTIGLKKIKPSEEHNQKLLEMCLELSCRLEYGSFYYKDKIDRLRNDDPARKKYQLHYGYALLLESLVDALSVRVSDDFKKRPQYQYLLKMLQLKRELTVAVSRGQDVKAKQVLLSQMVHFDNAVRHSGLSTSGQNKAYSVIREPLGENKNAQSVDAENTRNKKAGVSLKSVAGTFMAALRSVMTTHLVLAFPRVFAIPFGEKWVKQSQEDYANTKIQKPMADLLEAARSAEDLERDLIVVDSVYQPVSSEAQTGKVVRDFKDIIEDSRDEDIVPPAIGLAELEDSEGDVVRASSAVDTDVVPSGYNLQLVSNDKGKEKADSRTIYFEVKDSHLHYSIMLASEEWFGGILKDIDMDEDNLNDAFLQQNYHRIVTEIETQMDETVIPTPPSSPSFEQKNTQLSLSAQRALTQTKKELSPLFTLVLPPDSPILNRSNTSPLLAQGNPPSGCSSGDTLITVNPYQTPGLKAN
ncbi:MAG: ankyrin repeat domain-containing protein, partial [Gammaproteobacteria bacterium]|nr:ankyrin repeat domain-containing protein [Gammaproteobacteria bacterium]